MGRVRSFTRGALAARMGCNIETIRYYEDLRLLPAPAQSAGGHRLYDETHVARLRFVRRARELGFTRTRSALLRLGGDRYRTCAGVQAVASRHRQEIGPKLRDLRRIARTLDNLIAACADGTLERCPLIETLSRAS